LRQQFEVLFVLLPLRDGLIFVKVELILLNLSIDFI